MSRAKRNAAAEEYFRRAPNYSAKAIEAIRSRGKSKLAEGHRGGALMTYIADLLESAHKFALPYGGKLFDTTSEQMLAECRLPFRVCAFEYEMEQEGTGVATGLPVRSDKTIVLAVEDSDASRTRLFPIVHTRDGGWQMTLVAIELVREDDENIGVFFRHMTDLHWGRADDIPAQQHLEEYAREAFGYEIRAITQACAALACTNVTTEILRPNREARAARPASTLFDYHVLVLDPSRVREPGEDRGGTHASPRTHLRRGHIRRHPTAGRIWVNQCVVAPTSIGTVNKDYRVKRPS